MPETFFDEAIYENTTTAIPYFLTEQQFKWGHWIFSNQFLHYFPNAGKPYITSSGDGVVMTLTNLGTRADKAKKTADGTGITYRQIAGFEKMKFSIWSDEDTLQIGDHVIGVGTGELYKKQEDFILYPNPVDEHLLVETIKVAKRINFIDQNGRSVIRIKPSEVRSSIDVSALNPGMYIVQVIRFDGNSMQQEIIKQ